MKNSQERRLNTRMGCKTIITQSSETFSLDKMYDEDYTLQQIYNKFKQLSKNHKTLSKDDTTLLEEIYDYLEENYYKYYICEDYFEDHEFVNENATRQECYIYFTEFDNY